MFTSRRKETEIAFCRFTLRASYLPYSRCKHDRTSNGSYHICFECRRQNKTELKGHALDFPELKIIHLFFLQFGELSCISLEFFQQKKKYAENYRDDIEMIERSSMDNWNRNWIFRK